MDREADWSAAELAPARLAVDSILRHQEPYPAVVMNRHWDIVATNAAASRVFARFLAAPDQPPPLNVVRLMFSPTGLRPSVRNWEAVAEALVRRVHREAVGGAPDAATAALLQEVLAYPGVPSRWRAPDLETPLLPFLPVSFAAPDLELNTSRRSPRWARRRTSRSRRSAANVSSRRTPRPPNVRDSLQMLESTIYASAIYASASRRAIVDRR